MNSIQIISGFSISVALIGVTIMALFTEPYVGLAKIPSRKELEQKTRKEKYGKVANIMIVLGTLGQLVSVVLSMV
ncbi:MAG: hypothetical protein JXB26_18520 [Candidatus Aminicenantes bacterium]|nr:hypothetical protein [Candidatus Aminicenantes bacterium]